MKHRDPLCFEEEEPEMAKAGAAVRLNWDQTLVPLPAPPNQLSSGELEKLRDEEEETLYAVLSNSGQGWCQQSKNSVS